MNDPAERQAAQVGQAQAGQDARHGHAATRGRPPAATRRGPARARSPAQAPRPAPARSCRHCAAPTATRPAVPALAGATARQRPSVTGQRAHRGHAGSATPPERLGQVAAGEPGQPRGGGHRTGRDRPPRSGQHRSGGQPRLTEVRVRHPVTGAAQHRGREHGLGGGGRLFDVGQEVEPVAALVQQRPRPPGRGQQHRRHPPARPASAGGAPAGSVSTSPATPARRGWRPR